MTFQAIKFVMLDFDKSWDQLFMVYAYANVRYTATRDRSRLTVVFEGATGVMQTRLFLLPKGAEVNVLDQIVHVPARCAKGEPGNLIRCSS